MAHQRPIDTVLVKPAGPDCNMACNYCFYLQKADLYPDTRRHRMTEDVLDALIRQVMQDGGRQVSFGWQGGEPTLMGLPFFQRAVELQRMYGRPGQVVGNGLQTNGLLIGPKWADFLAEHRFLVGLSLDGPKAVHDHDRRLSAKKGSWQRVMESARRLLERGVEVNVLSVITDHSAAHAREIYEFHTHHGFNWMQFIPCVETDPDDPSRAAPWSVSAHSYGQFLIEIFDLWRADFRDGEPTTSVRFFDSVFHTYVGATPPDCHLLPECGVYTVVEHNGDIYVCDFFVEPEWRLGNVLSDRLVDALNSARMREFGREKANLSDRCSRCRWLPVCYGGCTKDRVRDPADQGHNHFCESMIMFFEHADRELRALANQWRANQGMPPVSREGFDA